jgi:signal transduction histidine kinase
MSTFPIPAGEWPEFRKRLAILWGFAFLIALALWGARVYGGNFAAQLVYTYSISTLIFLFVDLGRFFWYAPPEAHHWPSGWRWILHNVLSIGAGYVLGTAIGDWYSGRSTWRLWQGDARQFAGLVLMAVAISVGFVLFFYQRSRLAGSRREVSEAQLLLLQSQLEPHMLFNTLANLRALIATDPAKATAMLDHLDQFLRASLSASRAGTHSLGAEFARLRDYLEIMAVRMGPRLRYRLELPAALEHMPVPALLLQPLVENSIRHGLEPKVEGGALCVSASLQGERLVIEVGDSGVGLPAAATAAVDLPGGGFGLSQVRERLASRYGGQARIELVAGAAPGTTLRIVLPAQAPAA